MRTLLIDGDTLVFEAASANEYEAEWGDGIWTLHANLDVCMAQLAGSLKEISENLKADRTIVALSAEGERWRNRVMPTYKNKRTKTRKPVTYRPLREWVHEMYETFERPTLEGDDVLGILATHPELIEADEKIIVAIDKDMQTIPGLHVNYARARESGDWQGSIYAVTPKAADRYHLYQTLTGDSTDGYSGCPGIGPVKAEKILADNPCWASVRAAYHAAGLSEAIALQNARVARICRHTEYDFKKKEVKLWTPSIVPPLQGRAGDVCAPPV